MIKIILLITLSSFLFSSNLSCNKEKVINQIKEEFTSIDFKDRLTQINQYKINGKNEFENIYLTDLNKINIKELKKYKEFKNSTNIEIYEINWYSMEDISLKNVFNEFQYFYNEYGKSVDELLENNHKSIKKDTNKIIREFVEQYYEKDTSHRLFIDAKNCDKVLYIKEKYEEIY